MIAELSNTSADFNDLYVKMRRSAQGSAFWGLDFGGTAFRLLGVDSPKKHVSNGTFKPKRKNLKNAQLKLDSFLHLYDKNTMTCNLPKAKLEDNANSWP